MFNPAYTAALLQLDVPSHFAIQELGCAQFGIGILGVLSLPFFSFRKPAAVSAGVFLLGAAILHIMRLSVLHFDEAVSLFGDLLVVAIALVCVFSKNAILANIKKDSSEELISS